MTRLAVLETTVQKTHEWLRDIKEGLGFDNDRAAYAALRAVLHALRGLFGADDIAHLGAQLPMLIRGIYYEGWDPTPAWREKRREQAFLAAVARELHGHLELQDTERVARVVLRIIAQNLTPGETHKIIALLPHELRALWPAPGPAPDRHETR
jgi:uncharacterized protein (DUF2267 family)